MNHDPTTGPDNIEHFGRKDTAENFDTNAEAAHEQKIAEGGYPPLNQGKADPQAHVDPIVADLSTQLQLAEKKSAAAAIMGNPARAAGMGVKPTFLAAPPGTPEVVQKVLNALPGLIGAVDNALRTETGETRGIPFALVMFTDGIAVHASNFNPEATKTALVDFAKSLSEQRPLASGGGEVAVPLPGAANDTPVQ